jgi:membrane protein insertase Oxa1/YidC/SpoIIIJ
MVIMAPFAAGLQLYWVTNNILSIAQQKLLYWRHPEMRMTPAPAGGATPPPPPAPAPPAKPDLAKPAPNQRRSGGRKPKPR